MRRIWSARRGPVVYVSACLLIAGLAGCRGDDPGPAAPTTMHPGTAVTPTSSTPTGDPSDIAAAAAIAAVQKLYAELNASLRSGITEAYRQAFTRQCSVCLGTANSIDRIHERRQRIVGGRFYVSKLVVVFNQSDRIIVQGVLRSDPLTVRAGAQVVDRDSGSSPTAFTWEAKPVGVGWAIASVEVLK